MPKYIPETPFIIDGSTVYNLRQQGWRKGVPVMVNDITIGQIAGHHLSEEVRTEIAGIICAALNEKYPVPDDKDDC